MRIRLLSSIAAALIYCPLHAATPLPPEAGQTLRGYQDGFNSTERRPEWVPLGADVYKQQNGVLRIATAGGDPNHLVVQLPYHPVNQEILARIKVVEVGWGDGPRGGLGLGIGDTSRGVNLHFRYSDGDTKAVHDNGAPQFFLPEDFPATVPPSARGAFNHLEMLNDLEAWGPEYTFAWQTNTFYWIRLKHGENLEGANDLFAKIWRADGVAAEPAAWMFAWDYTPARAVHNGFAGLTASSGNGKMIMECDFVLIKADGLPLITVGSPEIVETNVRPGGRFHPASEGFKFKVAATIDLQTIELKIDGQSKTLQVTGNDLQKEAAFMGLEANQSYVAEMKAISSNGAATTKTVSFSTFPAPTEVRITQFRIESGEYKFQFEPLPNLTQYSILYKDNLTDDGWLWSEQAVQSIDGNFIKVLDPISNAESRFYKILGE